MNIQTLFSENIKQALMITSFVMAMMLIIEFINVFSKGRFSHDFKKNPYLQILFASLLGAIPGCLGTYAVVSLFTHNVIGFGALLAAMISTAGDETFIMLSMIPSTALKILLILFLISLSTGFIVHFLEKKRDKNKKKDQPIGFPVHEEVKNGCLSINLSSVYYNFRFITFKRALLLVTLIIFIIGLVLGEIGNFHGLVEMAGDNLHDHHDHSSWVGVTFLIISIIAMLISVFATNHFIEHHLWNHIIKVHFLRIFLWTFGALIVISLLASLIDISHWMETNKYLILFFAILIGIIPASGPHIIFITLFFSGSIPFSILLANSIVQDGHGALPLFAETRRNFVLIKTIKVVISLLLGLILLFIGS